MNKCVNKKNIHIHIQTPSGGLCFWGEILSTLQAGYVLDAAASDVSSDGGVGVVNGRETVHSVHATVYARLKLVCFISFAAGKKRAFYLSVYALS